MENEKWHSREFSVLSEKQGPWAGAAALIVIAGTAWYLWGGGLQLQTSKGLDDTYQKVASDSVQQYNIAKRNGSNMDACVAAGIVVASYLQAKDEQSYQAWKAIQDTDCAHAGISR